MTISSFNTTVKGHVLITDAKTGEVLLDRPNAVHNQNMAAAIARGLSNTDFSPVGTHQIYALALGNGGSSIDSMNQITYLPPNVTGSGARLYNQTYFDVVDQEQANTPAANSVTYQQSTVDTTSIVIVTMTISAGEPSGQDTTDSPPDANPQSQNSFDELVLYTYGTNGSFSYTTVPTDSLLLTHIIFSPILKTANREIIVTYTLTVSCS